MPRKRFGSHIGRRGFLRAGVAAGGLALVESLIPRGSEAQESTRSDEALQAEITVHANSVSHRIDLKIYGSMIEHLGRGVYGGVCEEGSPLSDKEGIRKDVLAAAKGWGVSIFRWPGGNFASGYHWIDGIGPKELRPRKYNMAWYEEESNHFGTHEMVDFCRKLGAEPYICVNLGTGTPEEASNWVEYCNGTGDTYFANLRRKNGQKEPFNIKYWGLGNEVYGSYQIGHKDAADYAKVALETAKMMKWVDPNIRVSVVGADDPDWNRTVLEKVVHIADYISVHDYEGSSDYYQSLASVRHLEKRIRDAQQMIDLTDPLRLKVDAALEWSLPSKKQKIEIAVDEWNVWYRKYDFWHRDVPNPEEEVYNLADALWVASALNLFHRMGDTVTLATMAQLVNVLAPMLTSKSGLVLQPTYFPMKLYCQHCGPNYLQSHLVSPSFSSKYGDIPYLDISATGNDTHSTLSLSVVNRHESHPISASISIDGFSPAREATCYEIIALPSTENTFDNPHQAGLQQRPTSIAGAKFEYLFPPHSITMLKLGRV